MAQCKLTPREFIGNAFSPQVAAVCSPAAEAACQKNNLTFVELLQPFCKINAEGHFKDPQGASIVVRNLRVSVQDVNARPPQPTLARKMLNESAWREMFLAVQFPSDHEFTKHFLACMIVVSAADDDPLEKIQHMGAQLHQSAPGKLPKWFNNNALRYYILIHDASQDDKSKTESAFAEMKSIYGANNCFLLRMNSRTPGQADDNAHLPDPWSQFLVKHSDPIGGSDRSSSPRTPADTGGVSGMPSKVTTESDKTSHAGTPVASHNPPLISPDRADAVSLSSELSEPPNVQLEIGQEAVPVTIHPLSPDGDGGGGRGSGGGDDDDDDDDDDDIARRQPDHVNAPINANVWAGSPNRPLAQHGARLSSQDLERLRALVTEFVSKSLLPYVERQIGQLNDVVSNKKGVSRSLFSATKRWFGTNKPSAPASVPTNAVVYSTDSPEIQLRRMGDLCFMFGHYPLAYQAYHTAKRDFAADQAWLYYAGALEMAALSAFMQGEMSRKAVEYMDDAILTYLNSCKMPQFATRATLLSAECLKGRGLYGEAAKQLIRMTSEDSDLRSALLLEQAAYCFVGPKMTRKYAFHAVLAGHRFSKAGQRKHSLRCYQQAFQVYRGRGWSLAEDHIHFTIGRQAASLKLVAEAAKAFEKLLGASSKQPAPQQAAFLREFLHIRSQLVEDALATSDRVGLPILPLPLIDANKIKVLPGPLPLCVEGDVPASHVSFDSGDTEDARWSKLEEILVTEAQNSVPMIFKPTVALYSDRSNNSTKPNVAVHEPVHFSIELHNPLRVPLPLSNVKLLWSFANDEGTVDSEGDRASDIVETRTLEAIVLQPECRQNVVLSLTPGRTGELKVLGLSYSLSNPNHSAVDQSVVDPTLSVTGKRMFEVRGPKLKNPKERNGTKLYGDDFRLSLNVVEKAPFAQVYLSKLSPEMLCGEMQRVEVTLKNIGHAPLTNIHVGTTDSKLISLEGHSTTTTTTTTIRGQTGKVGDLVSKMRLPPSTNGVLNVGETYKTPLWVHAPHRKGNHRLDLLFYYENPEATSVPRYRLCRHTWQLTVLDSLQISAIARRSAATCRNDTPTMNLTVVAKNTNQVHDPFMNEIVLSKISLRSASLSLAGSAVLPYDVKIQPQEMSHLLLKLRRRPRDVESEFSDVSLTAEGKNSESVTDSPYIDFVQRRHIQPLDLYDGQSEQQQQQQQQQQQRFSEIDDLSATLKIDSTLILRWRANVTEGGMVTRRAIGQHHVDLEYSNKLYKHPDEPQPEQNGHGGQLRIFGPDKNVPDSNTVVEKNGPSDAEIARNVVSFSLSHVRQAAHNFAKSRLCHVPVTVHMRNHSLSRIDVKINTIGTSSQNDLPSIKSQLYSPRASTFFRYARHTSVGCEIEPQGHRAVELRAILASPGTYDLASRVNVLARVASSAEFLSQKWRTESVCVVSDDSL